MLRLCLPAWCASACLLPSPMGTPSPSRPSTGFTATPSTGRQFWTIYFGISEIYSSPSFSDLTGLERGVWDQAGLGTTPWSPVLTPSTGAIIMQAEPPPFEFCFIVNSKLIFKWKIKDWQNSEIPKAHLGAYLSWRLTFFLKGLFTIFCLSFKSHILDSNGVFFSEHLFHTLCHGQCSGESNRKYRSLGNMLR